MSKKIYKGTVIPNRGNGSKFGYPTANIAIEDRSDTGVYIGYTSLVGTIDENVLQYFSNNLLPSVIFIGTAETLGATDFWLETHILDFPNISLQGSILKVQVIEKIRDSEKFASEKELIDQMKLDEAQARKWFTEDVQRDN